VAAEMTARAVDALANSFTISKSTGADGAKVTHAAKAPPASPVARHGWSAPRASVRQGAVVNAGLRRLGPARRPRGFQWMPAGAGGASRLGAAFVTWPEIR